MAVLKKMPVFKGVLVLLLIVSIYGCPLKKHNNTNEQHTDTSRLHHDSIAGTKVKGAPFKHYTVPNKEPNEDKAPIIPEGPKRGELKPLNKNIILQKLRSIKDTTKSGDDPVVFGNYNAFGTKVSNLSSVAADMSVGKNGNVVLVSGNWYAALSTDGGNTFTGLDPTTIFPTTDASGKLLDGGFCCDQVITYVPRYDMFVWLMQFCGNGANCNAGTNRERIAVARTQDVINSAGTAWTYWDFTSALLGQTSIFDYPDVSVGTNDLYWSADVLNTGLIVVRLPLSQLQAGGTLNFDFTDPTTPSGGSETRATRGYGAHLTQNTGDQVMWAGHVNSSTIRIFSMQEGQSNYSWRSINIDSWPTGGLSSTAPDGSTNWLGYGFPGSGVIGAARQSSSSSWFAWSAPSGGGFPTAHVQMLQINTDNWTKTQQVQVWNKDFAFSYPYLSANIQGELGMSMAFGGGSQYYGSHVVGIWGDFVLWYPDLSDVATGRWGDYTTVRRDNGNSDWYAAGYVIKKTTTGIQFNPHYIFWGRASSFVSK